MTLHIHLNILSTPILMRQQPMMTISTMMSNVEVLVIVGVVQEVAEFGVELNIYHKKHHQSAVNAVGEDARHTREGYVVVGAFQS